mmetsp:Transcript_553/g.1825  ORF Transcript_553/g.1825 Transcript_553/m.1825 type:complete len:267 (-) Transcript_553:463-1263(-)
MMAEGRPFFLHDGQCRISACDMCSSTATRWLICAFRSTSSQRNGMWLSSRHSRQDFLPQPSPRHTKTLSCSFGTSITITKSQKGHCSAWPLAPSSSSPWMLERCNRSCRSLQSFAGRTRRSSPGGNCSLHSAVLGQGTSCTSPAPSRCSTHCETQRAQKRCPAEHCAISSVGFSEKQHSHSSRRPLASHSLTYASRAAICLLFSCEEALHHRTKITSSLSFLHLNSFTSFSGLTFRGHFNLRNSPGKGLPSNKVPSASCRERQATA